MKFSIITAAWNSEATILDTLRSLEQQEYPRDQIEWILVDGGSTDRTLELIKEAAFQPDRMLSEKDAGIYDALNKGIRMATGDTLGFLHADDVLASSSVLSRISCAFKNSGAEAVYGDLQYVKVQASGESRVVRHWESGVYYRHKLKRGWMPPHPSLYLKREVYERAKLENGEYFDTSYTCAADYDFMLRILLTHEVEPAYLRMMIVKMRVGGISNRSLRHLYIKSKEDLRVIRNHRIGGVVTLAGKNLGKLRQFVMR